MNPVIDTCWYSEYFERRILRVCETMCMFDATYLLTNPVCCVLPTISLSIHQEHNFSRLLRFFFLFLFLRFT